MPGYADLKLEWYDPSQGRNREYYYRLDTAESGRLSRTELLNAVELVSELILQDYPQAVVNINPDDVILYALTP